MKRLYFLTLLMFFVGLSLISEAPAQTRGWGANNTGALGLGSGANQPSPQAITALPDATGASGGIDHTLFLRADGTLAVAGANDFGQFGDNLVATGSSSPVALV